MSEPASMNRSKQSTWLSEPILGLAVAVRGSPWRLGPAWAVLAGALAGQAPLQAGADLLRLGGSLVLADAVWGVFWRRPRPQQALRPKRDSSLGLPYAAIHSPLMEIVSALRYQTSEEGEASWQGTLVGLGLAAILSVLLGTYAVILTLIAVIVSTGIRLMAQRDKQPALLIALVSTGLPWALGAALGRAGEGRPATGVTNAGLALGVAFTCLTWAVASTDIDDSRPLVGSLWFGQVVILITLITVREPLGAAMVGGLLVVPCLRMMGSEGGAQECTETLAASGPWWLASMFAAALAARF